MEIDEITDLKEYILSGCRREIYESEMNDTIKKSHHVSKVMFCTELNLTIPGWIEHIITPHPIPHVPEPAPDPTILKDDKGNTYA